MDLEKLGVVVINADCREGQELCAFLQGLQYPTTLLDSLETLEDRLQASPDRVVILDLDTVPLDNQFIRLLKKKYPQIYLLGISTRSYHPGMEETIGMHFYACLLKPVDWEELEFWLNSIAANAAGGSPSGAGPVGGKIKN